MYKHLILDLLATSTQNPAPTLSRILTPSKDLAHGDYALPCFFLSKEWKLSPPECATKLASLLALPPEIERTEVVGPYLNFFLKRSLVAKSVISKILSSGTLVGQGTPKNETIIVEYSSVNIAKPFHIGHLRTTLIGHALDRIYRHLGYNVVSINHLGDWGTQFGFVWAGCELWGKPKEATIFELVNLYGKATTLKKAQEEGKLSPDDANQPNMNELARGFFLRLEDGDKDALQFWRWCLDISMSYLKTIYERLGIHFDHFTGESFYRDKLKEVEEMIRQSGILEESRGALGVQLEKRLGFVRIFAEDGRSLYVTRDLATAHYRYKTFSPRKILYVVGSPQNLYFEQLIGVLKKLNHPVAELMVHVSYGNVPGVGTRGRSGTNDKIWLDALLDEAHERALNAYRSQVEKRPEGLNEDKVAEAVGLGAIAFNYLSRSNIKEFHFSWDEALNFQGDTGPYLQYALARINSIEEKAREAGIHGEETFNASLLQDDSSYQLISLLSKFEEALQKVTEDYEPHHLSLLLLELAKTFSSVYRSLRVIGEKEDISKARLALFKAVKYVLYTGMTLIGVPPLERM